MDAASQTLNQAAHTSIAVIARSAAHKETLPDRSHIPQNAICSPDVGPTVGAPEEADFFCRDLPDDAPFRRRFRGRPQEHHRRDLTGLAFVGEEGDGLCIFGFSRGAIAARRLAGFISVAGIVSRRHAERAREGFRLCSRGPRHEAPQAGKDLHADQARAFCVRYGKGTRGKTGARRAIDRAAPIPYVAAYARVFDTAAQRGAGEVLKSGFPTGNRGRYRLRDRRLTSNVDAARPAAAIDECRAGFPATLWEAFGEENTRVGRSVYLQRWFAGYHGDIGGGRQAFTGRAYALHAQAVNSGRKLRPGASGAGRLGVEGGKTPAPSPAAYSSVDGGLAQGSG